MSLSHEHPDLYATPYDETLAAQISDACGLGSLASRVLVIRGIESVEQAQLFLTPSLERDWVEPACIPGMLEVADIVEAAIKGHKRIVVFGDFDVDGITATAISVHALRALGADAHGFIPHRHEEGYALSEAAIERAMKLEPDLVMTVDCGIACAAEVNMLQELGVEVCITDHHEPGDSVPVGVPVADPKLDDSCPSFDLAGAGVALKLATILGDRFGKPDLWRSLTDLAALGTIADLMPLRGENRALVSNGLERIRNSTRPGLLALATTSNVKPQDLTSLKLSFSLIPRLNSAGRMGDAMISYELLMSDTIESAQELVTELEQINTERRAVEAELNVQVEEYLEKHPQDGEVIVVAGEGWHEGIKGIVASRLARAHKKPAIVFSIDGDTARGSGRTFGDINLFEAVSGCADLFDQFGGHMAAVGITLPTSKLDDLRASLCRSVAELRLGASEDRVEVDAIAALEECTIDQFLGLKRLEPYGNENPAPLLALRNVFLEQRSVVGKDKRHLRYKASDGTTAVSGIYFGPENLQELMDYGSVCDIVFEADINAFRGNKEPQLVTKDIFLKDECPSATPISETIDELFKHEAAICETGEYAGITQTPRFNTKVAGVTFENRQDVIAELEPGVELKLERQPQNEFDPNAIAVTLLDGRQLGFLGKHLAAVLAPDMDDGVEYDAAVSAITGGQAQLDESGDVRSPGPLGVRDPAVADRNLGVNIVVRNVSLDLASTSSSESLAQELEASRRKWESVDPAVLDDALREALIGQHSLHAAQKDALASLSRGKNTLAIMATGRGKSLIFHLHAARMALLEKKACIFVYPLRALVTDQAFHLQDTFARFGLRVEVLTGESSKERRDAVYEGLADGSIHCILTTPEFLSIHAKRFAQSGRVGFVVIDEAHHVALARAGNRSAYASLNVALDELGNPLVLAVTATSGTDETQTICDVLSIEELVLDPAIRENLHLDDRRDIRNREQCLARIIADGHKAIVYVNSRDQTISLARTLKHFVPNLASRIGFYNAGLTKAQRKEIEEAFREGSLCCIISTSAFGEGIDIPDVEHVVLYHLPFNDIEFNQMSGRAGRDGRDATVHLLFSLNDARINEFILESSAPSRDSLVALYKVLLELSKDAIAKGDEGFQCTNQQLAERASKISRGCKLNESSASCGISVFRELGFLQTSGQGVSRYITLNPNPGHMELEESVRYKEGLEELDVFKAFKSWAFKAHPEELLNRFNKPILPDASALVVSVGGK